MELLRVCCILGSNPTEDEDVCKSIAAQTVCNMYAAADFTSSIESRNHFAFRIDHVCFSIDLHATHRMMKNGLLRVGRLEDTAFFGNEEYSKEELVAELGSSILVSIAGLETEKSFRNNAAYIQY